MDDRLTITEAAQKVGVTSKTITRWEKAGKIRKSKRDWRGWRFYTADDLMEIKKFKDAIFVDFEPARR